MLKMPVSEEIIFLNLLFFYAIIERNQNSVFLGVSEALSFSSQQICFLHFQFVPVISGHQNEDRNTILQKIIMQSYSQDNLIDKIINLSESKKVLIQSRNSDILPKGNCLGQFCVHRDSSSTLVSLSYSLNCQENFDVKI